MYADRVDVYAPCALGGAVNNQTVEEIVAPVVAGAANNQLVSPAHGARLRQRGILYAPDYAINAGGVIEIASQRAGRDQRTKQRHLDAIALTLQEIFELADESDQTTAAVADQVAEERFTRG